MGKITDKLRNGEGIIDLVSRELINPNLSSEKTVEAITDLNTLAYPRYLQMGTSVFDVRQTREKKVPSLAFEAKMMEVGVSVPESVIELDFANLPPKRVGVSVPISKEIIASMGDHQLLSFLYAGIYAIQEEILGLLMNMALAEGNMIDAIFNADNIIDLQRQVDSSGVYFGSGLALLKGKETPLTDSDNFLFTGDIYKIGKSFDGIFAFGSKKLAREEKIGYGDFKFSAVLLYSDYKVIVDRYTRAKEGKIVYTFFQMANAGIADKDKFSILRDTTLIPPGDNEVAPVLDIDVNLI